MIRNDEILKACELLKNGKVVAFPTETVYGLGADASNEAAIKQIFAIKKRPLNNPLIVHLADHTQVADWAHDVSEAAHQLMAAFWPGPLTLLLKKNSNVSPLLTANQPLVGLRVPKHPVAKALLQTYGSGLAAPSANQYTRLSPTTAQAVIEALGASVDMVLDGGPCTVGLESTILDMSRDVPVLLRPGMIPLEEIESIIQQKISSKNPQHIRAPGQHFLHYAPLTPVQLVQHQDLLTLPTQKKLVYLTYQAQHKLPENIHCMLMPNHPVLYAQQLYEVLRKVDNQGYDLILIEAVPTSGDWHAINDRLQKATAVRSAS